MENNLLSLLLYLFTGILIRTRLENVFILEHRKSEIEKGFVLALHFVGVAFWQSVGILTCTVLEIRDDSLCQCSNCVVCCKIAQAGKFGNG